MACDKCGGSGWLILERDGISAAEKCNCSLEGRSAKLIEAAQIPPAYKDASVYNFLLPDDNSIGRSALGKTVTDVKKYARSFMTLPKSGLMLIGETGTGKTHLAVGALRQMMEDGHQGLFFDYQNLLDRIRASYNAASGASDREAFRSTLDAEVLLLDDLGAHRVNDWVEDTVTSIITWRCNHRKTTLVTTNLTDPDVGGATLHGADTLAQRIGQRARSRLFEMCKVIRMPQVEDYRVRSQRAQASTG